MAKKAKKKKKVARKTAPKTDYKSLANKAPAALPYKDDADPIGPDYEPIEGEAPIEFPEVQSEQEEIKEGVQVHDTDGLEQEASVSDDDGGHAQAEPLPEPRKAVEDTSSAATLAAESAEALQLEQESIPPALEPVPEHGENVMQETQETIDQTTTESGERTLLFHAVVRTANGVQIVQNVRKAEFEKAMSNYKQEDVIFAVKGHELKPQVKLTF